MILKDADPIVGTDRLAKAGGRMEQQMAFYLRRSFANSPDVIVLNDVRLVRDGDAAQIDHLVLGRHGVVIIESKSVSTKVKINERGEWCRLRDGHWSGMKSPLLQAKLQADFLRSYLDGERGFIAGESGSVKRRFDDLRCDVLVAVSDHGIIERPRTMELPNVMKAERIVDCLKALLDEQAGGGVLLKAIAARFRGFSRAELTAVGTFLRSRHTPLDRPDDGMDAHDSDGMSSPPPLAQQQGGLPQRTDRQRSGPELDNRPGPLCCRHCGSETVELRRGYSLYVHCQACGRNGKPQLDCGREGCQRTLRQRDGTLLAECDTCGSSVACENVTPVDQSRRSA